jgi:AcrR family transcriptional regulator
MEISNYRLPRTKHGMNTFENIVISGKKLFGDKGYHSTSINDIVSYAEIAAGTFYIYFNDKMSLYQYVLNNYKHAIRHAIWEATKDAKTRYQMEREGIKAFIKFASDDTLAYNIIWESLFIDRNLFKDYYENFSSRYVLALQKSFENGEIRFMDFETLSYILMGISNFVGLQVIFKTSISEDELNRIVDQVMNFLYHGMFVRK